jgi:hypothetical protein
MAVSSVPYDPSSTLIKWSRESKLTSMHEKGPWKVPFWM